MLPKGSEIPDGGRIAELNLVESRLRPGHRGEKSTYGIGAELSARSIQVEFEGMRRPGQLNEQVRSTSGFKLGRQALAVSPPNQRIDGPVQQKGRWSGFSLNIELGTRGMIERGARTIGWATHILTHEFE
jgi:hypothetical protein